VSKVLQGVIEDVAICDETRSKFETLVSWNGKKPQVAVRKRVVNEALARLLVLLTSDNKNLAKRSRILHQTHEH
jgi:type III secretory pathway component EscV